MNSPLRQWGVWLLVAAASGGLHQNRHQPTEQTPQQLALRLAGHLHLHLLGVACSEALLLQAFTVQEHHKFWASDRAGANRAVVAALSCGKDAVNSEQPRKLQ
jgi:hypothetical protein